MDLLIGGEITKEDFRKREDEYKARVRELQDNIERLSSSIAKEKKAGENLEERVRMLVGTLKEELDCIGGDEAVHEMPEWIIDAFVERIVVKKNEFDWYLRGCKVNAEEGKKRGNHGNMLISAETDLVPTGDTVMPEDECTHVKLRKLTFTREDAKRYLYSIDHRRRVITWEDIKVNIFV